MARLTLPFVRPSSSAAVSWADGFYEWTGPKGKRQPLRIHPRAGDLMLFLFQGPGLFQPRQFGLESIAVLVFVGGQGMVDGDRGVDHLVQQDRADYELAVYTNRGLMKIWRTSV